MRISFKRTTKEWILFGIILALALYGAIASFTYYKPVAIWFVVLFLLSIPKYEFKGSSALALDIVLPVFAGVFTLYFVQLVNTVGHAYFKNFKFLVHQMNAGNIEIFVTLMPLVIFFYFFFRLFCLPRKWAAIFTPFVPMLFGLADYYVFQFRGQEFMAADLSGFGTAMDVAGGYKFTFFVPFTFFIIPYALFILVCLRIKTDKRVAPWYICASVNMIIAGTVAAAYLSLFNNYSKTHALMPWGDEGSQFNGFLLNYSLSVKALFPGEPEGYEGDAFFNSLGYENVDIKVDDPVNIIVIMNESYTDPDFFFDNMNYDPDPYWDSLSEEYISGTVLSSIYGGRTPNSEYEMLTSITTGYLPGASVPFSMYINHKMPSMASFLSSLGYHTTAMHPYNASGWSRTKAYPNLGFDDMFFIDDFEYDDSDLIRNFVSDKCAYDNLIANLNEHKGTPTFTLLVTMQNHGGYTESFDNHEVLDYVTDINDGSEFAVNNYISLVKKSDEALEYLIDYLDKQDEKYVLLIYGDHQPSIAHMGSNMAPGGNAWYVPYIIWANYDIPSDCYDYPTDGNGFTSINYLGLDLLKVAGIELPPYYQLISDIRNVVPSINAVGYYSNSQSCYLPLTAFIEEGETSMLRMYMYFQYNIVFDHGNNIFTTSMLP